MDARSTAAATLGLSAYWLAFKRPFVGALLSSGQVTAPNEAQLSHLVFLGMLALFAVALFAARRLGGALDSLYRTLLVATCSCSLLGNVFVTSAWPSFALSALVMAANAAAIALLAYGWMGIIARMPFRTGMVVSLGSFALSCAAGAIVAVAGILVPVESAVPALSGAFLLAVRMTPAAPPSRATAAQQVSAVRSVALIAAFLVVSSLARGILYQGSASDAGQLDTVAPSVISFVASLALIPAALASNGHRALQMMWLSVSTLLLLGLFALFFSFGADDLVKGSVVSARTLLNLVLWMSLACLPFVGGLDSLFARAAAFLLVDASSSAVTYVMVPLLFVNRQLSDELVSTFVAASAVLLLLLAFWTLGLQRPLAAESADPAGELRPNRGRERFEALMSERGLTQREREIALLIAEGNTMRKIADTLCVSLGTVQSHAKSLYRKLGTHSRQEVVDLMAHDEGPDAKPSL